MNAAASNAVTGSNYTITSSTGILLPTSTGERPAPTPKEMIATRAIQAKGGWLGQIIMAGEIVFETKPQKTSQAALGKVNRRIHNSFKRLVIGVV